VQLTHVELAGGPSKLPGPRRFQLTPRHWWLVNPGSVGQPRDGDPRAAYAMWDHTTGELVAGRVEYDIERTLAAIRAAGLPARLEERLRTGT
jgi:diadenosine tetraphosphatase ApaH/serine/threonine PP2A family protein phosphatase